MAAVHSLSLLKLAQAVGQYGVCATILREQIRRGAIKAYRNGPTGKYRIDRASLEAWLGMSASAVDGKKKSMGAAGLTIVYCRISSQGASDKLTLARQVEDVSGWCVRELGESQEALIVVKEQVSGMLVDWKSRPGLKKVWELVKEGNIKRVVIKNRTRLARLPGAGDLLTQHFADYGVELIEAMPDADDDADGELNDDIQMFMSLATVICNRRSGLRAGFKKKVTISETTLSVLRGWQSKGKTLEEIAALAKENGLRGTKFDGREVPLSKNTIWRNLAKGEVTESKKGVAGLTDKDQLIREFAETTLRRAKGEFVPLRDIYSRYSAFAKAKGAEPATPKHVIGQLRLRGWTKARRTKQRRWFFVDCRLV